MGTEYNDNFIGVGSNPNPDVPDIPLGLGMALAQDGAAMTNFGRLSNNEKTKVIQYVQASVTGDDAKSRIATAVKGLSNQDTAFMNQ